MRGQRNFPPPPRPRQTGAQPSTQAEGKQPSVPLDKIISEGDAEALVESANELGKKLKEGGLKTSQIRGIFGTVRRIEMDWLRDPENDDKATKAQRELRLLDPKLAYQAKRTTGVEPLRDVLSRAIRIVLSEPEHEKRRQGFQHFVEFFEAIIAYHRAYGGVD